MKNKKASKPDGILADVYKLMLRDLPVLPLGAVNACLKEDSFLFR